MKLSDLDYPLPKEKIALYPVPNRPAAKLLCVDRATGEIAHRVFSDILDLLKPSDVLVLNNAKVLPARLIGKRATGGKVEALLLKEIVPNTWETLLKPGGRVKEGERIVFGEHTRIETRFRNRVSKPGFENGELVGIVLGSDRPYSGQRRIRFEGEDVKEKIRRLGHVPLPPYIDRPDEALDRTMYQTVFAEKEGAVASPTAGLHFDEALLSKIRQKGVTIAPVTLHVSYGTFQPITVEEIDHHQMFEEEYGIPESSAAAINKAKQEGRRVVVCGTTCVRALESSAATNLHTGRVNGTHTPGVCAGKRSTSIFIHPPYDFKIVDALITNFHMPKSTLLAMLAAFLGYPSPQKRGTDRASAQSQSQAQSCAEVLAEAGDNEYNGLRKMMNAYNVALKENYRFASYGDAMFIH